MDVKNLCSGITYNFAEEFSKEPGGRTGKDSGEEFKKVLKELLNEYDLILIDATNITGSFLPSFLDEAFSEISKELGNDEFFRRVKLFSDNNAKLYEEFVFYAKNSTE